MNTPRPRILLAAATYLALLAFQPASAGDLPFTESFESGLDNWTMGGTWSSTTNLFHSPTQAITDSPGSYYNNNTDASATLAGDIDLSGTARPSLAFYHHYSLESGYDFGQVEVSTDSGATWVPTPLVKFTGESGSMVREQLDLSAYIGTATLRLRFRLLTDSSVVRDGWTIDDITIAEGPAAVNTDTPTGSDIGQTHVDLAWTESTDPAFSAYLVLRSRAAATEWEDAYEVVRITNPATVTHRDIAVSPKTKYYYRVLVENNLGLHTESNEVAATTLPGMDFPFLDNGEGGPATWVADAPWALSDEAAASFDHAWSDSPGGDYANGMAGTSLTLSAPLDLSATTDPVLSFLEQRTLASGDSALVEVSVNNGASWSTLATHNSAANTEAWQREALSLGAYRLSSVLLRFRLTSDGANTADGWHLDDISVAERPSALNAPVVDQITSSSARLTWGSSAHPQVIKYVVFRAETASVGIKDSFVGEVPADAPNTLTDTALVLNTDYFYRVFAVTSYGAYSIPSATAATVHTLSNPEPWSEDAEDALVNWDFGSNSGTNTWAISSETAHSGSACITDSPSASYDASKDTWIETSVDLTGSEWPVLEFWDRYDLGADDWIRLEISATGKSTHYPYGHSQINTRADWQRHRIDLSPWSGSPNVRLRFRLISDSGATPGDGWFLDDLSVTEHTAAATPLPLPFADDFEDAALPGWQAASWHVATDPLALDGSQSLRSSQATHLAADVQRWVQLEKPVVLPADSNVQATFWIRGHLNRYSRFRMQYSENDGASWVDLTEANINYSWESDDTWLRKQASLQSLAGKTVRLRFNLYAYSGSHAESDLSIDKFTLADMPAASTLTSITPALRSMTLEWDPTTLGTDFLRYELWRSTVANVSVANGEKVFESANPAITTATDSGLNIGGIYHYKLFTVDTRDTYIPSNEMSSTTVPVVLPFADSLDNTDNWVIGSNNANPPEWGVATTDVHEGSGCLAASPVGQYAASTDSYVETAVDLTGSEWPVLEFWDRYDLGTSDWIRLEISAVGKSTQYPYGQSQINTRADWQRHRIDLSPWSGSPNVRLRFRLISDGGATPGDGWFLDDLSVTEHTAAATPLVLPYTDDFEDAALPGWQAASWHVATDPLALDGSQSLRSSQATHLSGDVQHWMQVEKPVVLPADSNVQATFWIRGHLNRYSRFRMQYSENDGASWGDLTEVNTDYTWESDDTWLRRQASLQSLAGKTVRLRFNLYSYSGSHAESNLSIDKFTLADMPAASPLTSITPALRSMTLEWDPTTLGADFLRYELWRSTVANVSVANGEKVFESANPAITTTTDSGLNIGGIYHYKLFTIDTRDTYIASNEMSSTTVPVVLPFADSLDNTDNWVIGSNNTNPPEWGVATSDVHEGSGCLAASPVGQYAASTDSYVETAVDLTGSEWPVLEFWDRYDLGAGDWIRLEISATGKSTHYPYGLSQINTRADWQRHRIDLSPWSGSPNVRLRFRLISDGGATPGDGWFLDDLSVTENTAAATPLALPFTDDFEDPALPGWQAASWHVATDPLALDGSQSLRSSQATHLATDVQRWVQLEKPVVLPADSNVQATFWIRGHLNRYSRFRMQYSENDGASWGELPEANINYTWDSDASWLRRQASLQSLAGKTVRLRFNLYSYSGSHAESDLSIDKFTLAEMPATVTMRPIDQVTVNSQRLNWEASTLNNFTAYRIHRSTSSSVTPDSELIATLTDVASTSFVDTALKGRTTYYYRVYVADERDTWSPSDIVSSTTLGIALPMEEDFELELSGWTLSGDWQRLAGVGRSGGTALVDSDGDYAPSSDTHAVFAVDLTGKAWPTLRFWDKHVLNGGSWGRVEISTDGTNWPGSGFVYAIKNIRATWQEQAIDLSPWKDQERVFIRFRQVTDGNLADGWTIDDVQVSERPVTAGYPIFEGFESPNDNWLISGWAPISESPYEGASCLLDTESRLYGPDTMNQLVLGREVDLTTATAPTLTCLVRGNLSNYSRFRAQISTNGGRTWSEISAMNLENGYASEAWEKKQASLASWVGSIVRLRFITYSYSGSHPASDIFIDNIGVGEDVPEAPVPLSPADQALVTELRPTLTVTNAIDHQSDALTYQFEVYSDSALTQLVAQVPAVASGIGSTSWQVDVNLPDNANYWWRCRASDGINTGEWSMVTNFAVNEFNNPPNLVEPTTPLNGGTLYSLTEMLIWRTTDDPDPGDQIRDYQIEIADNDGFIAPIVSVEGIQVTGLPDGAGYLVGISLDQLTGINSIRAGGWFWRIRARDSRYGYGPWSTASASFRMVSDYERWVVDNYTAQERLDPSVSGPLVDNDGDGVPQMIEFACGMDMEASSIEGAPELSIVENGDQRHLAFEFDRKIGTDLRFQLEWSGDLHNWSPTDATMEIIGTVDTERERCRLTDPLPVGTQWKRFLRVEINLP